MLTGYIFASTLFVFPRLRCGVDTVWAVVDWGGGIEGHVVYVFNELEVAVRYPVPGDHLSGMGCYSSHQCCDFCLSGSSCFVVGLVLADGVEEELPFYAVRIGLAFAVLPDHVLWDHVVGLIDFWFGLAEGGHCDCGAFGAVGVV